MDNVVRSYAYRHTHRLLKAIASANDIPIPEAAHRLIEAGLGFEQDAEFVARSCAIARTLRSNAA